jgi:peptidyl-prolyl cis-trans isomerase SurA
MRHRLPIALLASCLMIAAAHVHAQGLRLNRSPESPAVREAASAPVAVEGDYIVALVNTDPVTNNEVRSRLARLEAQSQAGGRLPPRQELIQMVLDRLISEKALLSHANETGVKVDDASVDQAEQTLARQNQISLDELRRRVAADGVSVNQFRTELRNQIILARVRERDLEPRVRVTDLEADQFILQQQRLAALAPPEINLAHILVSVPEGLGEADLKSRQAIAEKLADRARGGADFGQLAQQNSQAPDRVKGGELGLRSADRYPPLFVEATQALPVGGISDVVRSGAGFHVLKVLDRRQPGLPAKTVTQNHARHILLLIGPKMSEAAAREQLLDLRRRVLQGNSDFAALARQFSQDGTARKGGDLGWTNPGVFVPEFEEVLNSLAPGEIAQPLVSRFGMHLIQLLERRQSELNQAEQRDLVRGQLREKKMDEAYDNWVQEIRGRAYIEMRDPPQ